MESLFKEKFPKTRPKWLVNDDGNRLELDGYCERLNIAFEHNGNQHYQKVDFLKTDLSAIQKSDRIKKELCDIYGIKLIIIPQVGGKIKLPRLMEFIKQELIRVNVDVSSLDFSEPDLAAIYTNKNKWVELKETIEKGGGKLLTDKWSGAMRRYHIRCNKCHHEWYAFPHNIVVRGEWCKKCAGKLRNNIEDAKALAHKRGGICLSNTYKNNSSDLMWKCGACSHIWKASYNKIQSGGWCPMHMADNHRQASINYYNSKDYKLRSKKEKIEKLNAINEIAKKHKLKCISDEYVSCDAPLIFQCEFGHHWKLGSRAFKKAIKKGNGCSICRKINEVRDGKSSKSTTDN